jgi:hypothetical protein
MSLESVTAQHLGGLWTCELVTMPVQYSDFLGKQFCSLQGQPWQGNAGLIAVPIEGMN